MVSSRKRGKKTGGLYEEKAGPDFPLGGGRKGKGVPHHRRKGKEKELEGLSSVITSTTECSSRKGGRPSFNKEEGESPYIP